MSESHSPSRPPRSDRGLRIQSGSGQVADLDASTEGEREGLGCGEGTVDAMDESGRQGATRTDASQTSRVKSTLRHLPEFDWGGPHNTFEWIIQQSARLRSDYEIERAKREAYRNPLRRK